MRRLDGRHDPRPHGCPAIARRRGTRQGWRVDGDEGEHVLGGVPPDISACLAAWKGIGVDVDVYGYDEVDRLLRRDFSPADADLVRRVGISACRSDVARWVLLHEHGGLYVDAHGGPPRYPDVLRHNEDMLRDHDLVLYERVGELRAQGLNDVCLSVIAARSGTLVVREFVTEMLETLRAHAAREEQAASHVEYNIFELTGGWAAFVHFFDLDDEADPKVLKAEFSESVQVEITVDDEFDEPVDLYRFYDYRRPGRHWSERQESEPLFRPPDDSNTAPRSST